MIIVNGVEVGVSENLEAALQEMSIHMGGFKIWIDALCINQNDLTERSHQVKRMKEIYRGASKVIAWMGPKTQDTHLAFQVIKDIATETWNKEHRLSGGEVPVLWNSIRTDRSRYTDRQWSAFDAFLELPYWSRVWIIQELAMSNFQAAILWGDETSTLLNLAKAYYECIWQLKDTIALRICQARSKSKFERITLDGRIVTLKMIMDIQVRCNR
jgi:hypothetical protein